MGETIRIAGRAPVRRPNKSSASPRPVKCRVSPNTPRTFPELVQMADTEQTSSANRADMANAIRALAMDAVQ
ncbi:hypothetical protein, partial [Rhodoferax sp.]|uniref:hypothetical protein n=1 Tax=Rhodoferax sp. TaxID=50421 RepID=UPI00272B0DD3